MHTKDTQLREGFGEERAESRTTKNERVRTLKTLSSERVSARNEPKAGLLGLPLVFGEAAAGQNQQAADRGDDRGEQDADLGIVFDRATFDWTAGAL